MPAVCMLDLQGQFNVKSPVTFTSVKHIQKLPDTFVKKGHQQCKVTGYVLTGV